MNKRKIGSLSIASVAALALMGAAFVAHAAQPARNARAPAAAAPQQPNFDNVQIRILHVQGNVYLLNGAGGNTTVQIGNDGVLVVDTQFAPMADKLLAEIRKIAGGKPIRFVIDTHGHPDHVGGNERIRRAGAAVFGGNVDPVSNGQLSGDAPL